MFPVLDDATNIASLQPDTEIHVLLDHYHSFAPSCGLRAFHQQQSSPHLTDRLLLPLLHSTF